MRVLVTGGTGRVGAAIVRELIARGHAVHVLTRRIPTASAPHVPARTAAREVVSGAEYVIGDLTDARSLRHAADRCAAVVHAAAIRRDERPLATLHATNIEGTRHLLEEARRAGVSWVVYVSRLGADRITSPMLRSRRHAEMLVRELASAWLVLRPGGLYGPQFGPLAAMLEVVRRSPFIPVSGNIDTRMQPLWIDDFATVVARGVERRELAGRSIDVAGDDCVSLRDVHAMMNAILQRRSALLNAPHWLADAATRLMSALPDYPHLDQRDLRDMQTAGVLLDVRWNPLRELFGVDPLPLRHGLEVLAGATKALMPVNERPPAVQAPPGVA